MNLLTPTERDQLLENGRLQRAAQINGTPEHDFNPVVKLFTAVSNATWLLTELDPEDPDVAFGLCDLGLGCPELGYVSISDLESVRGPRGPLVERDLAFTADRPRSAYAREAREEERIRS